MGVTLTSEMIQGAQETEKLYGVPASITLGQIMLESGGSYSGGLSGLAVKAKNLFGIKGSGSSGTITMPTTEYKNGIPYLIKQKFASYKSYGDSILAHGKLLTNERYASKTKDAKTVEEYAKGVADGGYATDPNYSNLLINIINKNGLKTYDKGWKTGGVNIGNLPTVDADQNGSVSDGAIKDNNFVEDAERITSLKWWGDIVVIVFVVICVGIGIVFFLGAFQGGDKGE